MLCAYASWFASLVLAILLPFYHYGYWGTGGPESYFDFGFFTVRARSVFIGVGVSILFLVGRFGWSLWSSDLNKNLGRAAVVVAHLFALILGTATLLFLTLVFALSSIGGIEVKT
jgi:hypothetical protein